MPFTSASYFIFFVAYLACTRHLKSDYHLQIIIIGGLIFYGWGNPIMVCVPTALSLIAFGGVRWFMKMEGSMLKQARLCWVIALLLAPLIYFKYKQFLYNEIFAPIAGLTANESRIALPLGISFMTFTIISYVVDAYRKKNQPAQTFYHLFAYTLFFPRLIAGPILRPSELIPQLLKNKSSKASSIGFGLTLFTVGIVKKVIFADSIGDAINPVFDNPTGHSLPTYWLAILGYTLQIYCDFSGYTDMAMGSSIMLGIRLPLNFDRPYIACNLQDFWRRWHMTLSRWLRDYIYIPLGGNRCSNPRYFSNIFLTMLLCGIWHGASWTFILWGIWHGIGLMTIGAIKLSPTISHFMKRVPTQLKWLLTFVFLATTWVFFRAADINTALIILTGAFMGDISSYREFFQNNMFPLTLITLFALSHRFDSISNVRLLYRQINKPTLGVLIIMIWAIAVAANTASSKSFIYFDF